MEASVAGTASATDRSQRRTFRTESYTEEGQHV